MSLLAVSGLSKRFGGVAANLAIAFDVAPGELVGVIARNGAGTATEFDLITGFTAPEAGDEGYDGRAVTGMRADEISRLGVARTCQKLRPFAEMTVLDNV